MEDPVKTQLAAALDMPIVQRDDIFVTVILTAILVILGFFTMGAMAMRFHRKYEKARKRTGHEKIDLLSSLELETMIQDRLRKAELARALEEGKAMKELFGGTLPERFFDYLIAVNGNCARIVVQKQYKLEPCETTH